MRNELKEFEYLYKNYESARITFIDVTDKKDIVFDENFIGLKRYFGYTLNIVFKEYCLSHKSNKSSNDGPNNSIII